MMKVVNANRETVRSILKLAIFTLWSERNLERDIGFVKDCGCKEDVFELVRRGFIKFQNGLY